VSATQPPIIWTLRLKLVLLLCLLATVVPGIPVAAAEQTYRFKVLLDGKEIGAQTFVVSSDKERTRIEINASFDVKVLFFTAYSYRHINREVWQGECLREISATTNDNGDSLFVRGAYSGSRLELRTHVGEQSVEGCVRTFAYWNRDWLQSPRLLNSQTGEVQDVRVWKVAEETVSVRGVPTETEHIRIVSKAFTIDLWYDKNRQWVGLQSTTKNGGTLHYQLM